MESVGMNNLPTVYIVDDDPATRLTMLRLIEAHGLRTEAFSSAGEFLDRFEPERPGCLLLDVRMPGICGLQLQKTLAERNCTLPVIFVTGYGDVPMATETMRRGAFDFLEKPFRSDALLKVIHKAIEWDLQRRGERTECDRIAARLATLSDREREVLSHVVSGERNKLVASKLGVTVKTVEAHRSHIMRKTGARSVAESVRFHLAADRQGAVNPYATC